MTRDIKFRAWDGIRMWPVQRLTWATLDDDLFAFEEGSDRLNSDLKLMQYTGHKSIDGQEVYEDDLLSFPSDDHVYRVKWLDGDGCWGVMHSETIQMGKIGIVELMKVVGNVHQNRELITKEQS